MATKTDDKKLYKKTRAEYLELKQQFEILQESFGMALDKRYDPQLRIGPSMPIILQMCAPKHATFV